MSFFHRTAYIEFVSKKSVIITTPFAQKRFDLFGRSYTIDLINLKKTDTPTYPVSDPSCEFFVTYCYDEDMNSYAGEVFAKIDLEGSEIVGDSDLIKNNKKAFRATVWTND